jgi:F0F1-type ATP synthase assembly protein I
MNTTLTEEKTQLKQEVQKLKREQQTAWIKYITAVLLGTGIGVLADRMILRLNIESETHRI